MKRWLILVVVVVAAACSSTATTTSITETTAQEAAALSRWRETYQLGSPRCLLLEDPVPRRVPVRHRALAYLAAGQKRKARADFEKLIAADPGYLDVQERLALVT